MGAVGAVSALVPFGIALYLIWRDWGTDFPGETLMQWFGVTITIAVVLAQICLLLATAGDAGRLRGLLWATVGLAALMGLIVIGLITEVLDGDQHWRWIGVVAILDVLGTIVTMALAKFSALGDRPAPAVAAADGAGAADFRLPPDLAAAVSERAGSTGLSPQQVVEDAVRRALAP